MPLRYEIRPLAVFKIREFYQHVAIKYRHTYDEDDMNRNIYDALTNIYQIEQSILRRKPTLRRWQGLHMAHAGKWFYAYSFIEDRIIIEDACHELNMHDAVEVDTHHPED